MEGEEENEDDEGRLGVIEEERCAREDWHGHCGDGGRWGIVKVRPDGSTKASQLPDVRARTRV